MAEIILTGLEMPKDDILRIEICPNGQVNRIVGWAVSEQNKGKAIALPPHTKLTEQSAFWNMLHEICVKCNDSGDINRYPNRCIWCKIKEAYEKVYQTPTVLEASE